jgi:hypothetical protein
LRWEEAVDVVVFEDNLESNNPVLKLLKTLLFALFFAEVFLPKIKKLTYTHLKLHWLSPEILKAEKLIEGTNIKNLGSFQTVWETKLEQWSPAYR